MKMNYYYLFTLFTTILTPTCLSKKYSTFKSTYNQLHSNSIETNYIFKKESNIPLLNSYYTPKNTPFIDLSAHNRIEMFFKKDEEDEFQILGSNFSFPSTISNLEVYVNNEKKFNYPICNNTKINGNNIMPTLNKNSNITILFNGFLTDANYMFESCSTLVSLDLSNFNTKKINRMETMFSNCSSLISLKLENFLITKIDRFISQLYSLTIDLIEQGKSLRQLILLISMDLIERKY